MDEKKKEKSKRKEKKGTVIKDKMDKTIVVKVERTFRHLQYGKVLRRSKKYYAHDEKNEAKAGDFVRIIETRPLSKTKRWRLAEILKAS